MVSSRTPAIDLHEIHDVRKRLDGTVNDVVLAVVTGALRRFFRARRVRLKDLAFRVTVPVNLRGEDEERVGNRVGALFIDLPLALSPVVVGLALFLLYGREGWFGGWLTRHDVQVLFALPAMVLA